MLNLFRAILATTQAQAGYPAEVLPAAYHPFSTAPDPMAEAVEMYHLMRSEGCDHLRALHGGARWGNVSETALNARVWELRAAGTLVFDD